MILVRNVAKIYNARMEEEKKNGVNDVVTFALVALLVVIPIRLFIAQPFVVKGASMEPTFQNGDYLIVDQLSYRFADPKRGDVIILRYPNDPSVFFIKRVIGLPNETVELLGSRIIIRKNGGEESVTLDQSFIEPARLANEYGVYELGPEEYFVMGDNRMASSDSRSWGALPARDIVGHAVVRLLPVTQIEIAPGSVVVEQ